MIFREPLGALVGPKRVKLKINHRPAFEPATGVILHEPQLIAMCRKMLANIAACSVPNTAAAPIIVECRPTQLSRLPGFDHERRNTGKHVNRGIAQRPTTIPPAVQEVGPTRQIPFNDDDAAAW